MSAENDLGHLYSILNPLLRPTGDLYDDREEAESSEGSTSSPPLRQRPAVARQLSSQLRSRMCRSLGADLDQLLQEEARGGGGGGSEVARLNRLHLISSSLSLRYDLSSSSLSSCSTPPRCHSLADLAEGVEGRGGRRSLPAASSSAVHQEGPSRQVRLIDSTVCFFLNVPCKLWYTLRVVVWLVMESKLTLVTRK